MPHEKPMHLAPEDVDIAQASAFLLAMGNPTTLQRNVARAQDEAEWLKTQRAVNILASATEGKRHRPQGYCAELGV